MITKETVGGKTHDPKLQENDMHSSIYLKAADRPTDKLTGKSDYHETLRGKSGVLSEMISSCVIASLLPTSNKPFGENSQMRVASHLNYT